MTGQKQDDLQERVSRRKNRRKRFFSQRRKAREGKKENVVIDENELSYDMIDAAIKVHRNPGPYIVKKNDIPFYLCRSLRALRLCVR
jgi:hypothetical protein